MIKERLMGWMGDTVVASSFSVQGSLQLTLELFLGSPAHSAAQGSTWDGGTEGRAGRSWCFGCRIRVAW